MFRIRFWTSSNDSSSSVQEAWQTKDEIRRNQAGKKATTRVSLFLGIERRHQDTHTDTYTPTYWHNPTNHTYKLTNKHLHTNKPTFVQTHKPTIQHHPATLPYSTVNYKPTNLQKPENSKPYGLGIKENRPSSKDSKILFLVIKTIKNQFRAWKIQVTWISVYMYLYMGTKYTFICICLAAIFVSFREKTAKDVNVIPRTRIQGTRPRFKVIKAITHINS